MGNQQSEDCAGVIFISAVVAESRAGSGNNGNLINIFKRHEAGFSQRDVVCSSFIGISRRALAVIAASQHYVNGAIYIGRFWIQQAVLECGEGAEKIAQQRRTAVVPRNSNNDGQRTGFAQAVWLLSKLRFNGVG